MNIVLIRDQFTDKSTIGKLYIDNLFYCHTLEDVVRDEKIKHETAIPYGKYEVVVNWSNRFKRQMPLLINVPNFEGIRIHSGNTDKDTSGCILLGETRSKDFIGQSRLAYNRFLKDLQTALKTGKVFIEIIK